MGEPIPPDRSLHFGFGLEYALWRDFDIGNGTLHNAFDASLYPFDNSSPFGEAPLHSLYSVLCREVYHG